MNIPIGNTSQILIIDDHQIYLDGLEMMLSHSLINVSVDKASSLEEAKLKLAKKIDYDLILLDLNLNHANGFELCQSDILLGQPVAILSASETPQDILNAESLGLLGYLNKSSDNDQLISDVKRLLEGNCVYPSVNKPKIALTPRQLDVLTLLAKGYPNKTICRQLALSEATVKTHLRALFNILDVHTRTQCVSVARELNLL